MAGVYIDTSALGRVLLGEPDAAAVVRSLSSFDERVASALMRVELRRLALRTGRSTEAEQLLRAVAIVPLGADLLAAAEGVLPPSVATLDAIHLVTAIALAGDGLIEAVMTFDARLADGARHHGLTVIGPVQP